MALTHMAMTHGGNIFSAAAKLGVPWHQILDFSASINPLGPSARVKEAILTAIDRIAHYPDKTATRLRHRLAEIWGVDAGQVLAGNGSTDLMSDFCRRYPQGSLAVPVFTEFHRMWPHASFCALDQPAAWPRDGAFALTRPANPTGILVDAGSVLAHLERSSAITLVDESFIEFTGTPSLVKATSVYPHLLVLRSLTKFHALPGLRIGVLVGHPTLIAQLAADRAPWSVNTLAEEAALAALDDQTHAAATVRMVAIERDWLVDQLNNIPGITVWPSVANYLYVEVPVATALVRFAAERSILLRDCSQWPGFERPSVRIAVRRRWENERLAAVWKEFACQPC